MDLRYYREKTKVKLIKFVENNIGRLFTPLETLLLTLEAQGLLPKTIKAFEPFGGYGLWTVPDYVDLVQSLDIVELDGKIYSGLFKTYKNNPKVRTYHGNCLKFMAETAKTYNFVLSDFSLNMSYESFLPPLFKLLEPGTIMLLTLPLSALADFGGVSAKITSLAPSPPAAIFPWARNAEAAFAAIIMPRNDSL